MKSRCLNPKMPNYKYYGGKGVKICDRWLNSFNNFLEDMGEAPPGCSLDKDIKGHGLLYSKETCCWASKSEQMFARNFPGALTHDGRTQSISAWEREMGVPVGYRVRSGWSTADAITKPKGYRPKSAT